MRGAVWTERQKEEGLDACAWKETHERERRMKLCVNIKRWDAQHVISTEFFIPTQVTVTYKSVCFYMMLNEITLALVF